MSFNKLSFGSLSRNLHFYTGAEPEDQLGIWSYNSKKDSKSDVTTIGYFNELSDLIKSNDIMVIYSDNWISTFYVVVDENVFSVKEFSFDSHLIPHLSLQQTFNMNLNDQDVINIQDTSDPHNMLSGLFKVFCYTKSPSWYKKDIPNRIYKVPGRQNVFILNTQLTEINSLTLSKEEIQDLSEILSNTGIMFFDQDKQCMSFIKDNDLYDVQVKKRDN